jgi:ABC-type sulfate transport system substrate-binding protein
VADGLEADVITMNQHNDIDILAERGKPDPADWAKRLPNNSAPTTSVSVILVRKGNPKAIRDWSDLGRSGVSVIIPNPKTSGQRPLHLPLRSSVLIPLAAAIPEERPTWRWALRCCTSA